MTASGLIRILVAIALLAVALVTLNDLIRRHPEYVPWAPLALSQPIGPFTAAKLQTLARDGPRCRALLGAAGAGFTPLPPQPGESCGYGDAVTLSPAPPAAGWRPAAPGVACPMAAALYLWERDIVRPAAARHFGQPVTAIEHFGSYACRRINNRPTGDWSEHARANAIDIAGFRLADGRRIRVLSGWAGDPAEAAFLREVRGGACRLFGTTLSPDYNAAHADHLHLDQAPRGSSFCR